MTRRKAKETNIRKLTRTGGSLFVSIPKEHINEFKWKEKQKVVVKKVGKKLIIEDWPASTRGAKSTRGGKK